MEDTNLNKRKVLFGVEDNTTENISKIRNHITLEKIKENEPDVHPDEKRKSSGEITLGYGMTKRMKENNLNMNPEINMTVEDKIILKEIKKENSEEIENHEYSEHREESKDAIRLDKTNTEKIEENEADEYSEFRRTIKEEIVLHKIKTEKIEENKPDIYSESNKEVKKEIRLNQQQEEINMPSKKVHKEISTQTENWQIWRMLYSEKDGGNKVAIRLDKTKMDNNKENEPDEYSKVSEEKVLAENNKEERVQYQTFHKENATQTENWQMWHMV